MSKKQLWTPLSTILRSSLTSIPHFSPNSASQIQSFTSFSPLPLSDVESSRLFLNPTLHFLDKFKFARISFCSETAEKVITKCWNCNFAAETPLFLVCESCRSIQPVDQSVDYFQIFGLEKRYDIEDDNLEGKYKNWQKKLHPDLVHSKSQRERECAAEQSARVIDAYQTLRKPLSRAIYILKLEGVDVNEEETISEPELLAEILEIREAVEEAADSQALKQIQSDVHEKLKHWSHSFANAFQSQKYEEAVISIRRMTYYERVNEEIVKKL